MDDSRLLDLARLGAARAARAYGRMLGRALQPSPPSLLRARRGGDGVAGVVFELKGDLSGLVALLLPPAARQALLHTLCPGFDAASDRAASALREAGNIVASQAVSAVADELGICIAISVPTLVGEDADTVLGRMLARRGAAAAVSALGDAEGSAAARLVFAPDPASDTVTE